MSYEPGLDSGVYFILAIQRLFTHGLGDMTCTTVIPQAVAYAYHYHYVHYENKPTDSNACLPEHILNCILTLLQWNHVQLNILEEREWKPKPKGG